jgi:hypothetical protein
MSVLVVSYSRVHREGIRGLVQLLRSAYRRVSKAVFWDDDFEPGDPWFTQMEGYIDDSPQLFVFWCAHAATSAQVRREFEYALLRNKRVIPVLLDDTPLPAELSAIHGVDLRGLVLPHRASSSGAPMAVYRKATGLPGAAVAIRSHSWSSRMVPPLAMGARVAIVIAFGSQVFTHVSEGSWWPQRLLDLAILYMLALVGSSWILDFVAGRNKIPYNEDDLDQHHNEERTDRVKAETHAEVIRRFCPFLSESAGV